jgi:excisionase family DNA binding protein
LYRILQAKLYTIDNISKKPYALFVSKEETKLLSVAEAAERLGVTRARVNQFINENRLPAQRIGRSFVIKEKDLSLVENRKTGRPTRTEEKKNK